MNIHEKIKTLRIKNGLSQCDLARMVCVSHKAVFNWEKNAVPRPKVLSRLSDIFSIPVSDLLDDSCDIERIVVTTPSLRKQAESLRMVADDLDRLADKLEASR
jgi:transcriptional regulator with XRE-family HTH domain